MAKTDYEEKIAQWEDRRTKGRTSYLITYWVIPYVIILLVMSFGVIPFSSAIGVDVKSIGSFLVIFGPVLIFVTVLLGLYSWNYWEREWENWKIGNKAGITGVAGTRKTFDAYWRLRIALFCFPFLLLLIFLFFAVTIFWFSIAFLVIWLLLFVSSGLFPLVTMTLLKNPICGHGLLVNPEKLELYPNSQGSPIKLAREVLKGKPFTCMVCGERYMLEKKEDQVEIVTLERDTHEKAI